MALLRIYDAAGTGFNIFPGGPLFDSLLISDILRWAVIDNSNFTNEFTSSFSITGFPLANEGIYEGFYNASIDRYSVTGANWYQNGLPIALMDVYHTPSNTVSNVFPPVLAPTSGSFSVDSFLRNPDEIIGNSFNDWIYSFEGDDLVDALAGDDSVGGGPGNDTILGGDGLDNLGGGTGNDLLFGDAGNDSLWGEEGADELQGGIGNDFLDGGSGSDLIFGEQGDDSLYGGIGDDELQGGAGADLLNGGDDRDLLLGGEGNDFLIGASGNDTVWGGDGDDTLYGNFSGEGGLWGVGDDSLSGDGGDDLLWGALGNDTLLGGGGNDTLIGRAGNDIIDGGTGFDTSTYKSSQDTFNLIISSNSLIVEDRRSTDGGIDSLSGIERIIFEGTFGSGSPGSAIYDLAHFGGSAYLAASEFENFIELYIAYFNRAPDAIGLNFWGTAFANGTTIEQMAKLFMDQDETRATYPNGTSNTEFVTAVYDNVLGRIPDQDGFNFWVDVLNRSAQSGVTRDQFILEVLKGVEDGSPDRAYLDTKVDIGAYFAVHRGMSDVNNASVAMALYDGSQGSINQAVAAIDNYYQQALDPNDGEFLMQVVGVLDNPFA